MLCFESLTVWKTFPAKGNYSIIKSPLKEGLPIAGYYLRAGEKTKSKDKESLLQGFLLTPFPRCNAIIVPVVIIGSILSQVLIAGPIGSISW